MANAVCIADLERVATERLDRNTLDYYNSGADGEQTLRDNTAAYQRIRLWPRGMVDVSDIDTTQTVQGHQVSMPIGVAPTAFQRMAHPDGECAAAKAAEEMGAIFILSTASTSSIEEVAEAAPNCVKWFQVYILKDRELTVSMIRRAEKAGFSALVLTIDTQLFGRHLAVARNGFEYPPHLRMANFPEDLNKVPARSAGAAANYDFAAPLFDSSLTWCDLSWLRTTTRLPVIVKGVLAPADAVAAVELGVQGVLVSNHGGRQLDGCAASVDALPAVVAAVAGRCPVYLDGGVRRGTDALKALALGARCVFVGRPVLWALAADGERGVRLALRLLRDELALAMGLCGVTKVADITEKVIDKSHQPQPSQDPSH